MQKIFSNRASALLVLASTSGVAFADTHGATEKLISADEAGMHAMTKGFSARAADASLRAAAARVDQAWSNFLPRFTASYSYTRLSPLELAPLSPASVSVVSTDPAGTVNPNTVAVAVPAFRFPVILDNHALVAQVVVPLSDYFFRISQGYTAASKAAEAARQDARAAKAKAYAEGALSYYTWLRSRGAVVVAEQALKDQELHLKDATQLFNAGAASKADMLRADTGVAAAQLQVERARNLSSLAEAQLRLALHEPAGTVLRPANELDGAGTLPQSDLKSAISQAHAARPELLALDANIVALRKQASAANAGYYPQVAGVGVLTHANPNQRMIPSADEWKTTWSLGVQASWSPNDILGGAAGSADMSARAESLASQAENAKQGVELEVIQAHQGLGEARVALVATEREVASAEEAYRVAHELYVHGRATSTLLTDAETELTRARLDRLNALADSFVAKVKLEHATGADAIRLKL